MREIAKKLGDDKEVGRQIKKKDDAPLYYDDTEFLFFNMFGE